MKWDLVVIGGGAAGFYGAIQAATFKPGLKVLILEKTAKLLTKVRISGGGRCNVTHDCVSPFELARHYPRGAKALKGVFREYHNEHVCEWLASKGIRLKTERDGRMFPTSDDSETIIACFLQEAARLNIQIETRKGVTRVEPLTDGFSITTGDDSAEEALRLLIAVGGNSHRPAYDWIASLGHTIDPPMPSLFTFNDQARNYIDLMGVSVPDAEVKIVGTKLVKKGPVLITHWGLSGPAIITLSAWAAEYLNSVNYQFDVLVSWIGSVKEEVLRSDLQKHKEAKGKQVVVANALFALPQRLWQRLCKQAEIEDVKRWSELSQRNINKLVEFLIRCPFHIEGKTTYKDEFVTCGGVNLDDIDLDTMESTKMPGVYFAGEVINIDGETGGFNFQAAWTTGYVAARAISKSLEKPSRKR